jgi:hypothetical protein
MMLSNLLDVVNNPDLAENFQIQRNPGAPGAGGWQAGEPVVIQAYGVVSVAQPKQLEMIPEADRVHEMRVFHSSQPMYVTSEDYQITSDVLVWNGVSYRVLSVGNYPNRGGYYEAVAARMAGQ